ncbi:MAG TPA: TraR/DksA family transcriptional regulator [Vicinamibacteria bacterium]|nr:TraR/DksA family transcriptional regulator [Vicinamibacteria bacterium]
MKRLKGPKDRERQLVLKGMLEDRRREIQEKLRSLRETLPAEAADVRDIEEQSVDDFVSEVDFALMEMKSETLRQIDEALKRLETGGYGVCGECGAEIAEARLKAVPFARMCRDCQEAQEERVQEAERARPAEPFAREIQ